MSKVWMKKVINGKEHKYQCDKKATKKCKHDFYTCDKHYHGCEKEVI